MEPNSTKIALQKEVKNVISVGMDSLCPGPAYRLLYAAEALVDKSHENSDIDNSRLR